MIERFLAKRFRDDERGLVVIVVAVFMVLALMFLALVVDIGNGRQQRRQAQAAADAAALAAVEEIATQGATLGLPANPTSWTDIVTQVKQYAYNNFGVKLTDWAGCTDPGALTYRPDTANNNSCISADAMTWPNPQADERTWTNRVRVRTPTRSIKTVFGGAVGQSALSTQAVATATATRQRTITKTIVSEDRPGGPCAICVLGTGTAFEGQNGDITVTGGGVTVNSNPPGSTCAAELHPNGHLKVRVITGNNGNPQNAGIGGPGGAAKFCDDGDGFDPRPITKPAVDDPLAHIPYCGQPQPITGYTTWPGCPTTARSSSDYTLQPGVYSSQIRGSHFLMPGIYVIKDGIRLSGNDQLVGRGVTLYFACANYPSPCSSTSASNRDDSGITVTGNGNGSVLLNGPTAQTCTDIPSTCPYLGLTLFADRDNTSLFSFRGNGTNENGAEEGSSGTLYLKSGTFDLRGNGYTLASQIITGRLTMNGNPSGITVAYDANRNAPESWTSYTEVTDEAYSYDTTGLDT